MSAPDAVDPTAAGTGRLADRYTLGARRSRGPATDVHPGWDHHLDRPVTVELYRPDARPAHRYRREREVAVLAAVDHPAVLAVHDRGHDPASGRAYVVTRPLDGITLAERIRRGPAALRRVLVLGGVLADALARLHAAGVVHRRLTPSVIIMDRRAGPVLSDLDGIGTLDVEPVTLEEAVPLGDAVYLAPEQVAGRAVGPTADVYSLARILQACLAAPATHAGADPSVPAAPTPAPVRALLTAMTDSDPERRPGASRVVDELAALVAGADPSADARGSASSRGVDQRCCAAGTSVTSAAGGPRAAASVGDARPPVGPRAGRQQHRAVRVPRPSRRPRRRAAVLAALVVGLGIELAALGAGAALDSPPPVHAPTPTAVR